MSEASEATQFQLGNSAWRSRSSHGRKPLFATPEVLWDACCEYFAWIEQNPEMVVELAKFQGEASQISVPRRRNMSEDGLKIFLDIANQTWADYKANPDFSEITESIVRIIRTHKMDGAITGQFKESIVARELGLADKQEVEHTGLPEVSIYLPDNGRGSE